VFFDKITKYIASVPDPSPDPHCWQDLDPDPLSESGYEGLERAKMNETCNQKHTFFGIIQKLRSFFNITFLLVF
jgi:hypothetical protein